MENACDPRADLAIRALSACRTRLMMAYRFLDRALWRMPVVPASAEEGEADGGVGASTGGSESLSVEPSAPLATDGLALYVEPARTTSLYRKNPDLLVRALLHSVLHCVFRHPFRTVRADPALWSLACDICVEAVAVQLCDERFATPEDTRVARLANQLEESGCALTPAQVYRALLQCRTDPDVRPWLAALAEGPTVAGAPFARDSHERWDLVMPQLEQQDGPAEPQDAGSDSAPDQEGRGTSGLGEADDDEREGDDRQEGEGDPEPEPAPENDQPEPNDSGDNENDGDKQEGTDGGLGTVPFPPSEDPSREAPQDPGSGGKGTVPNPPPAPSPTQGPSASPDSAQEEWRNISQQIETEMQSPTHQRGDGAGRLEENLVLANRSAIDYEDFLRRFSTLTEEMKTNDEEFDYIYYTYGLSTYGNLPLIEPLEYQETKGLREFVIAIDTSGSCSGELVRTFLTRTCEILRAAHVAGERARIHLVQCDAAVQSDTVVTCEDDLRALARDLVIRGGGGTDFRPVFAYVDKLRAQGELADLRGLVYFTDGFGAFPSTPPDYDVAFVFVEDEGRRRQVPPWAMKVVMTQDEIEQLNPMEGR